MGLIIEKLGDNYVNVNSRDERAGEREREKQLFQQDGIRKKRQKDVAKRQQEIVRDINKSRSL